MPSQGHSAKVFKNIIFLIPPFAECRSCQGHSAKYFFKKIFVECLTAGTRQRRTWLNTVTRGSLCQVPRFCRELGTRQRSPLSSALFSNARHSAKNSLPSAILCQVRHSAKKVFAECLIFDTWQNSLHSAKALFQ